MYMNDVILNAAHSVCKYIVIYSIQRRIVVGYLFDMIVIRKLFVAKLISKLANIDPVLYIQFKIPWYTYIGTLCYF